MHPIGMVLWLVYMLGIMTIDHLVLEVLWYDYLHLRRYGFAWVDGERRTI